MQSDTNVENEKQSVTKFMPPMFVEIDSCWIYINDLLKDTKI